MGGRMERLESLLTAEISQVLLKDLAGQDLGLATITGVKVARDLSQATVYVSVLGDERRRAQTWNGCSIPQATSRVCWASGCT
jgi:ribosome-binding factor A